MTDVNNWMRALHIIGLILWMGGLFVLARHLAMHVKVTGAPTSEMKGYESKSYYLGVLPGFLLTLGSGLYLLLQQPMNYLSADGGWGGNFHVKLTLVVVLILIDQFFHLRMRHFHNKGTGSRGLFMAIHGIVALSFIGIVVIMRVRPFG